MNRMLIRKAVILSLILGFAFFSFLPNESYMAGGDLIDIIEPRSVKPPKYMAGGDLIDIIEPRSIRPPKYMAGGDLIDIIEPRSIIIEYLI